MCDFIHFAIFCDVFWKVPLCVFAIFNRQLNNIGVLLLNIIQKNKKKRFIYSKDQCIITDRYHDHNHI